MIVALNISKENPLLKLFEQVDRLLEGYQETKAVPTRGRPKRFHDAQILKCLVYQAFYRIVSFRELEWRLSHDPVACCLIACDKNILYAAVLQFIRHMQPYLCQLFINPDAA